MTTTNELLGRLIRAGTAAKGIEYILSTTVGDILGTETIPTDDNLASIETQLRALANDIAVIRIVASNLSAGGPSGEDGNNPDGNGTDTAPEGSPAGSSGGG